MSLNLPNTICPPIVAIDERARSCDAAAAGRDIEAANEGRKRSGTIIARDCRMLAALKAAKCILVKICLAGMINELSDVSLGAECMEAIWDRRGCSRATAGPAMRIEASASSLSVIRK